MAESESEDFVAEAQWMDGGHSPISSGSEVEGGGAAAAAPDVSLGGSSEADQAQGGGSAPERPSVDEELDGLPVFGADDDDEDDWDPLDPLPRDDSDEGSPIRGLDSPTSFGLSNPRTVDLSDPQSENQRDGAALSNLDTDLMQPARLSPLARERSISAASVGTSDSEEERMSVPAERQRCLDSSHTPSPHTILDGVQQSQTRAASSQEEVGRSECELQEPDAVERGGVHSPPLNIKDEPIDEGYDYALQPQSSISRIKEELENAEGLRISSVFSVGGNSSDSPLVPAVAPVSGGAPLSAGPMVGPPRPQPAQPAQPAQPEPPRGGAPPPLVRVSCSGCSKVLQKGQTAFQRKGSNQLFCSTVCLTGFNLPPAPTAPVPKKICHCCRKEIRLPKDVITAPVDSRGSLRDFCSQACLCTFKNRTSGEPGSPEEDVTVRCSVCKKATEIQHEVNHQGSEHKLCSDECFSRFRSSNKLTLNCCETCGGYCCVAMGNCHMLQIEDTIKKFCSPACFSSFRKNSGKKIHCPFCRDLRPLDEMVTGTNAQGIAEFFCSSKCVTNSQASNCLQGTPFPCTSCHAMAVPQYHLAMPDGSIRNFCAYDCVVRFQEGLNRPVPQGQMNGGSAAPAPPPYYGGPPAAARGLPYPHPALRPPGPIYCPIPPYGPVPSHQSAPHYALGPSHNPAAPYAPPPGHNPISPYAPSLAAPRELPPQRAFGSGPALGPARLCCKQCRRQFSSKPELLQYKGQVALFCGKSCCESFKRVNNVTAVCEYCKLDKVVKDVIKYDHQLRPYCSEGCKLLFKHDLSKRSGVQCRTCAYCTNMTQQTIQNHFGGKLEEFCTEECMSLYTVLFYEMAKCEGCKRQGTLTESLKWSGTMKHFCNLQCVVQFCLRRVPPEQQFSNGTGLAATAPQGTAQAPSSGLPTGQPHHSVNTALTGALPTSNTHAKIIGDASTQTDAMKLPSPPRRMLKNKALMCKPIIQEQGTQSEADTLGPDIQIVDGEKVRVVMMPVPVPVPVFIPVPVHMYSQYTPMPLVMPIPVPVPIMVPSALGGMERKEGKAWIPSHASVEEEKDKPVSHADQGSTYSGDLESEAVSTPHSWGEDSVPMPQPAGPSSDPEGHTDPATTAPPDAPTTPPPNLPTTPPPDPLTAPPPDLPTTPPPDHPTTPPPDLPTTPPPEPPTTPPPNPPTTPPPDTPTTSPTDPPSTAASPSQLDLEDDFPLASYDPAAVKEQRLTAKHRGRRRPRDSFPPRKRGRKRSVADGGAVPPPPGSKLNHSYGVSAWTSWVQWRNRQVDSEIPNRSSRPMVVREDVLQCSSAELSYGLCRFISEVRRPNGQTYTPDSIFYLCLGLQQYLFENGRIENIFTDSLYSKFTMEITRMLRNWTPPGGSVSSRVEEEYLWQCKQLGAYSPIVLLNTLLFFGTKMLRLTTVAGHRRLAFANVSRCSRVTKHGKTSYLRFRAPGKDEARTEMPALPAKRRLEEEEEDMEMPENTENPLRCPVRLYEFYLSKCSDSVKKRPDLFYLQPERSCVPNSPVWYSAQPLEGTMLESMLTRILAVREIQPDSDQLPRPASAASTDDDSP